MPVSSIPYFRIIDSSKGLELASLSCIVDCLITTTLDNIPKHLVDSLVRELDSLHQISQSVDTWKTLWISVLSVSIKWSHPINVG